MGDVVWRCGCGVFMGAHLSFMSLHRRSDVGKRKDLNGRWGLHGRPTVGVIWVGDRILV